MPEQPKAVTIPKQQLEIISYEKDKPFGTSGGHLDRVTAKNLSLQEGDSLKDKPLQYTIFKDDLKECLRAKEPGARFLADIEEKPGKPEYGPNRNIVQVYDGGEPVSKKKSGGGGYGKSPETIRLEHELAMERESARRRTDEWIAAITEIGLFLRSLGSAEQPSIEVVPTIKKYWLALDKMLDNYLGNTPAPATRTQPAAVVKPPDAVEKALGIGAQPQGTGDKDFKNLPGHTPAPGVKTEVGIDLKAMVFKNAGELKAACFKYLKLASSEVDSRVTEYDIKKPEDRRDAWLKLVALYGNETAK